MSITEKAPDIDVAPAVPDVPIRCTRAPVHRLPDGALLMGFDEQCQAPATWDELYRCEEGAVETGHRCDPHHAEAVHPESRTWCGSHGARHFTVLVASYPRSPR